VGAKIDTQSTLCAAGSYAARADQAFRRFQSDDAVEAGRHPARAGGVGAEREVDLPARDGPRRS
jgi:hypothetical protein